ncbi:MAG TPA: RIP metalloprotease RseP [Candidatus Bathyarchaeia archaeon]|nr:RIP metalloprotease RseP [Candidatus Bathyarchaeia archaeon]
MFTVAIFIIILGLLVFVHELGHFLVARRNGVTAEEFGFGFPPRIFGVYKDKKGKRKLVWGSKEVESEDTLYSVNWIPLGGFVKITGEDGESKTDPKSFASKSPFVRTKILAAGVAMNFLLAVVLLSIGYFVGIPQAVEDAAVGNLKNEKIQIIETISGSPAEQMGIKIGDQIVGAVGDNNQIVNFKTVEDVQSFINARKGKTLTFDVKRGNEMMELTGTPRTDSPANQGALGISLVKTAEVSFPWYEAIWRGVKTTVDLAGMIVVAFGNLLWKLVAGRSVGMDVSGPVGIAVLTGQVAKLGFIYILQFTALLSINLAIINILPIPALDGGRILFIMIEKLKGKPVSQRFEQRAHNIGFALLITLMVFVTFRDVAKLEVISKIKTLLGG